MSKITPFHTHATTLIAVLCLALLMPLTLHAYNGNEGWMRAAHGGDTTQLVFSHTYISRGKPHHANLDIATQGRIAAYVNGRPISAEQWMPKQHKTNDKTFCINIDISRLMRADTNTIAIVYTPTARTLHQLSVSYYGESADGTRFAYSGNKGWFTTITGRHICNDGIEHIDGRIQPVTLVRMSMPCAYWQPALASTPNTSQSLSAQWHSTPLPQWKGVEAICKIGASIQHILTPRYTQTRGKTLMADFAPGYCAFIRITLRNCCRGEHININGNTYVCNGEMDEQAYMQLCPQYFRRVIITGDRHFRPEQVQEVEAISIY